MKTIFSWSIIISIYTIFFYWYGYWYLDGYVSYFGTNIDSYNFSFQKILITGFMNSVDLAMYLFTGLVLVSLVSQFNISQIKFIFYLLLKGITYITNFIICLIIRYICKFLKYSRRLLCNIYRTDTSFSNLIKKYFAPFILILISPFLLTFFIFLSIPTSVLFITIYLSWELFKLLAIEIKKFNTQWSENKIRKSLDKEIDSNEDEDSFDIANKLIIQYTAHSIFVLFILTLLMFILIDTSKIRRDGQNNAQIKLICSLEKNHEILNKDFPNTDINCSNKEIFKRIQIKEGVPNKLETWYMTDLCLESNCLLVKAFNNEENYKDAIVKFIDIRNVNMFQTMKDFSN